jgi:hypothetical protein
LSWQDVLHFYSNGKRSEFRFLRFPGFASFTECAATTWATVSSSWRPSATTQKGLIQWRHLLWWTAIPVSNDAPRYNICRYTFVWQGNSGPNHTTSIYNATDVKIYNATNSLARFLSKNYFSPI